MARKSMLRTQREKTIINVTSKEQEKTLMRAVLRVNEALLVEFPLIRTRLDKRWFLRNIVENLRHAFTDVDFHYFFDNSSMMPDGGILSILDEGENLFPILISEKKNQGTNDIRELEGKKKQARGNAIERLGKNVIGFRTALKTESIFPFICFGDGCDFDDTSSILDRVTTIAQFGRLNTVHLFDQGHNNAFDRGSFYFKVPEWTEDEMYEIMHEISRRSVLYYFSKYGDERFKTYEP